ncbi:uncharacterized protein (DUF1501 family) [Bradyrhizobium japonicum]
MGFVNHLPTRRELLVGSGALFAWSQMPRIARAEGRDPRLLVVVLRGALDGLGAVAPVGDPDWIGLRGDRALVLDGKPRALPLDSFFALNPAMPNLHRLYKTGNAAIVHAAATPYRERSHFDGQDVLESGISKPGVTASGWLNRALFAMESGGRVDPRGSRALGIGSVTPLVVRGSAPVMTWVPQKLLPASEDTQNGLLDLYQHTDPKLATVLQARMKLASLGGAPGTGDPMSDDPTLMPPGIARVRAYFAEAAGTAARYLAKADGPRVGAMGFVGWDTHIAEGAASGQLYNLLGALDGAFAAIETNMGEAWRETVVAVVTEFGRTARINGTQGTDHGTGTVAFLIGGALAGGRVIADWPGLKPAQLFEESRPQADQRSSRRAEGPAQGPSARRGEGAGGCGLPRQRGRQADGRPRRLTARPSQPDRVHDVHADATGTRLSRQPENRMAAALSARADAAPEGGHRGERNADGDAPDRLARCIGLVFRESASIHDTPLWWNRHSRRETVVALTLLSFSQGSALIAHRNSRQFGGAYHVSLCTCRKCPNFPRNLLPVAARHHRRRIARRLRAIAGRPPEGRSWHQSAGCGAAAP